MMMIITEAYSYKCFQVTFTSAGFPSTRPSIVSMNVLFGNVR
jgi:hypothetical protein